MFGKRFGLAAGLILLLVIALPRAAGQTAPSGEASRGDAIVVEIENKAETLRLGADDWVAARTNQTLRVRDRFRTHFKSRATLQLSNRGILRVSQLTTLEIQPPSDPTKERSVLDVKSGSAYFFNRDEPVETQFRTPQASGAIRGTEFNIEVAENGATIVTLLDGAVDLFNERGQVSLTSGEQGIVEPGQAPRKTAVIDAINIIQWALYYPGTLDIAELGLNDAAASALAGSLNAYRAGDLLNAAILYPTNRANISDAEAVYAAAVQLAVGQVAEASAALDRLRGSAGQTASLAAALRQLIAAVKFQAWDSPATPSLATEWMALSYYHQSRSQLAEALAAAKSAAEKSPEFGFAWSRIAELEFSFGRADEAKAALDKSLQLSPRNAQAHALQGFLFAAENKTTAAAQKFEDAIALDGALGNAWLGRGLVKIRRGHLAEGRADLQVAATLEPHRSVLRSYLGKAFNDEGDLGKAGKELDLAKRYDPNDPTPWLYSSLLKQQQNRVNEAVRDLEKSQDLNDNRSVFRSRMLLDQDQAVRSVNLAKIYQDAGMTELSAREASRAVNYDYGNYSAHLFLANSYDALRDPRQITLRYDTPWRSELLLANLLSPVGAGVLSQNISQQEYSRLFERNKLGVSSSTEYFSRGDWIQSGSQFGNFGGSAYSLDGYYRTEAGNRPNEDLDLMYVSMSFRQQLSASDTLFLQASYSEYEAGDVAQFYDQAAANPGVRIKEYEEPNLYLGLRHEWAPGINTLFLASRLDNRFERNDPFNTVRFATRAGGNITGIQDRVYDLDFESKLEAYSFELQQIWQTEKHTLVAGARYQTGSSDTDAVLTGAPSSPVLASQTGIESDLQRVSAYAYHQWQVFEPLRLTAGLSYDRLDYPVNTDIVPVSGLEDDRDQVSPKVGFLYSPWKDTHFRGAYSRSLGGVFFDSNVRLEPVQIAGFTQSYRSLIPESVRGLLAGSQFEIFSLGFDHKFPTETYVGVEAELLTSSSERAFGVYEPRFLQPALAALTPEQLEFEEKSVLFTLNQLISRDWSLGATYRVSEANLEDTFLEFPASTFAAVDQTAALQQARAYAIYNSPSGFFGLADAVWHRQSNEGYTPDIPGDNFWQFNAYAGYRFLRRRAEVRVGLLNIADQDYQLNPLNLHAELPRERTFTARLRFNF